MDTKMTTAKMQHGACAFAIAAALLIGCASASGVHQSQRTDVQIVRTIHGCDGAASCLEISVRNNSNREAHFSIDDTRSRSISEPYFTYQEFRTSDESWQSIPLSIGTFTESPNYLRIGSGKSAMLRVYFPTDLGAQATSERFRLLLRDRERNEYISGEFNRKGEPLTARPK